MGEDLFIFDKYSVHERILYDKYKADFETYKIVTLPLLIPEYIDLTSENRDALIGLNPTLKSIGIYIEAFDENQLIIREVPQSFANI